MMSSCTHWADAVHQCEEGGHHPLLHLILSSFSLWTQGVQLVNEDDGRLSVDAQQECHKQHTQHYKDVFIYKAGVLSQVCQYNLGIVCDVFVY